MTEPRRSLMEPRLELLMRKVESKSTLVTLSARRAREINDYYNQLGEELGRNVPPQVTSVRVSPYPLPLKRSPRARIVFERVGPEEDADAASASAVASVDGDEIPRDTA